MTDAQLKAIARGLIWDDVDKQIASDAIWNNN